MGMGLGENLKVTIFGESHGKCVGALIEGIPPGTPIDPETLLQDLQRRKPGRKGMSQRSEDDRCEIMSGVFDGKATGWPILMLTMNSDAKSKDYSFLPDHPRPGHADLVESVRSQGSADLRGGGSQSARLTFGLVAAGSQVRSILDKVGWSCHAHLHSVGNIQSKPLFELDRDKEFDPGSDSGRLNCRDHEAAILMSREIEKVRKERDTIGSVVELLVEGLPIGVGEPWFDGIEPSLARALMAIPGARAVEFSHGVKSSTMRGSEHNDSWLPGTDYPILDGASEGTADGSLGGRSTGAPISVKVHFKPPSSLPQKQFTLHLPSNQRQYLEVGGRHDPVLGPRAAPVVEAVSMLVMADLGIAGGFISG